MLQKLALLIFTSTHNNNMRDIQKVTPLTYFLTKQLFPNHEHYTAGLTPYPIILWSPSISMALHQSGTSVCVCMPYWYHTSSCSSSTLHSMDCRMEEATKSNQICDGIKSLQTCVWPCIVMLKQDFC